MPNIDTAARAKLEQEIRSQILRRRAARLGFQWHAAAFLVANAAMLAINLRYSPDVMWFVWPLAAWSTGLAFHAFAVFGARGMSDAELDAEVQRELARRGKADGP